LKLDKLLAGTFALVLIAGIASPAFADPSIDDGSSAATPQTISLAAADVLIDFEACVGLVPFYVEDGATITGVPNDLNCTFTSLPGFSGTVAIGGDGSPFEPVRTDFPTLVTSVSAVVGDNSPDIDGSVFMEAYDVNDVLVDSDTNNCGACDSAIPLSVSAPNIAYIITGSTIDSTGSSVVVDDIIFTTQVVGGELLPIDNTALLLAGAQSSLVWMLPVLAGIAGTGFYLVKFRTNKE